MHDTSETTTSNPDESGTQDDLSLDQSAAHSATADRIRATQSAIRQAQCQTAEIQASAIGALNTQHASLEVSAVGALQGDHVEATGSSLGAVCASEAHIDEHSIVGLLIARHVHGPVRPIIDWRGAILVGLIAGIIMSLGRRGSATNDH